MAFVFSSYKYGELFLTDISLGNTTKNNIFKMETLPGSRTAKREGNAGAQVDPRKTNLTLGSEKVLYRTSSQSELVNHYDGPKKAVTTKSNTVRFSTGVLTETINICKL